MTAPAASLPPRRRRRRWPFALAALLLGLGCTLGLVEVFLRAVDPMPNRLEDLRWYYRLDGKGRIETTPGWRGKQIVDGNTISIRTNSLGLRGGELPAKAAGERRVLMIGDSFVWGMGVAEEQTIPAVLEQRLAAASHKIAIGNGGMWGTSPREWAYTVERFRTGFQPDLIVAVTYLGNDLSDMLVPPLNVLDGFLLAGESAHVARTSWRWNLALRFRTWWYLEWYCLNRWWPIAVPPKPQLLPAAVPPTEGAFFDIDAAHAAQAPFVDAFAALLRDHLRALQTAAGDVPVLVVALPSHEVALKPYAEVVKAALPGVDPSWCARGNGGRRVQQLCAELGMPCRDLDAEFAALGQPKELFLPTDWHLSPAGCAQVAAWLQPDVERLLPK